VHVVEIVEMDDEELYVPDDVLEEALSKIQWVLRQWAKNDERKWSERKRNLHPLVTMDADSLPREVSNKISWKWK
jgi:hypothetical protein